MSWKKNVKNWDGKLYKVLQGNKSCNGNFEWDLPKGGKPGDWTPIIENVKMCEKGYHLTTHYAHWADENVSIYEAEGDVISFDGFDKVVCSRARLLKLVENPFNDNNSGNYNTGCWNSGNYNSGDTNTGYFNSGNRNSGNRNPGNRNSGNNNSGDSNSGNRNSGNHNSGNRNSGNHNSGNRNSGHRNFGNWNSGSWNSGSWNSGNKNSGNFNFGNSNQGNYNFGDFNSGNYNSGHENSGNWNSGNYNSGCLCTKSSCIIFNKLIENWEQKYPEWMYFDLLPEGYHESWQKAFKNANIEGIKELLALPNFDYKIFEEISSITKEQIEEKLGE